MTPAQLGRLTALFDEIKNKINDETLEYKFVKDELQTVLEGPKILLGNFIGCLTPVGTFEVEPSPLIEEIPIEEDRYEKRFQGYSTKLRLGEFFLSGSAETPGGTAAVLQNGVPLTIFGFITELLANAAEGAGTDWEIIEQCIVDFGFSFSIKQVMEIIEATTVRQLAKRRSNSLIFLVHDKERTGVAAAVISSCHHGLFGRDLDNNYIFKPGAGFVVRTLPPHLQPK